MNANQNLSHLELVHPTWEEKPLLAKDRLDRQQGRH